MTKWLQYIISSLIVILLIAVLFLLIIRLSSQLFYLRASNQISNEHYSLAVKNLKKAIHIQPSEYVYHNKLGEAYYKIGSSKPLKDKFKYTLKSKKAYENAAKLNSIDAEAFYGLARSEAKLERLYQFLHHKINTYNAIPYFDEAIRLRPNSTSYRYSQIKYLYFTGRKNKCLSAISDLAKINPSLLYKLKQETFWSIKIREAVKKGFQQAIKEKVDLETFYFSISNLLSEEEDWEKALFYYEKYINLEEHHQNPEPYLRLSFLYLKTNEFKKAEHSFLHALEISSNKENTFNKIVNIYARTKNSEALLKFCKTAVANFLISDKSNVLLVKNLIRLRQYDEAKNILLDLNKEKASAENYYWLARIAEKQKNWLGMKLTAQKAVMMDNKNSDYHFLLSRILSKKKKLYEAERQISLAIKYAKKPSYKLFIHRASIRSQNYNFKGAAKDWESVISLSPRSAKYYAYAAEAYLRLGKISIATNYYSKAMNLDPKNKNYQKKYQELAAE